MPKVPQPVFELRSADPDSCPAWNPQPAPCLSLHPPPTVSWPGCGRRQRAEGRGWRGWFPFCGRRENGLLSLLLPRSSTCGGSRTCARSASLGTPSQSQRITRCSSMPTFLTSCTWTSGASMTTWQVSPSGFQLEPMPRGYSGDGEHPGEPSRSGEEDQPTGLRADPARPGPQSRAQRLGERGHLPSVGPTVCQNLLEDPQRWGGVRELPVIRSCLSLVP